MLYHKNNKNINSIQGSKDLIHCIYLILFVLTIAWVWGLILNEVLPRDTKIRSVITFILVICNFGFVLTLLKLEKKSLRDIGFSKISNTPQQKRFLICFLCLLIILGIAFPAWVGVQFYERKVDFTAFQYFVMLPIFFIIDPMEESAFSGYLNQYLPYSQKKKDFLIGFVYAFWHFPLTLCLVEDPTPYISPISIFLQFSNYVGMRFIMNWFRNTTGTIWWAVLFQSFVTSSNNVGNSMVGVYGDEGITFFGISLIMMVIITIGILIMRRYFKK
ncbi:MAG: type II CAAX prenyl endopeptidase Rce1 family protein [Promethearchaeota archaeon]